MKQNKGNSMVKKDCCDCAVLCVEDYEEGVCVMGTMCGCVWDGGRCLHVSVVDEWLEQN